jgi:hypothetical protein
MLWKNGFQQKRALFFMYKRYSPKALKCFSLLQKGRRLEQLFFSDEVKSKNERKSDIQLPITSYKLRDLHTLQDKKSLSRLCRWDLLRATHRRPLASPRSDRAVCALDGTWPVSKVGASGSTPQTLLNAVRFLFLILSNANLYRFSHFIIQS